MKNRFIRFTFVVFLSSLTSFLMASTSDGEQGTSTKRMNAQEYLSKIRNNQYTGDVSVNDVISARIASQALMSNKSSLATYQWNSLGPNNMAGPTKAVIFDNRDDSYNTLYAGSNSGGVWKSTNYGAIWEKVEMDDVLNVSSLAQASNGTIYVGTGVSLEPAADKISEGSTIGKGIWKSNGDSFELMPGTAPSGNDVDGDWAFIQKIAVDASGNLYAATNTGLKYFNGSEWSYAQADGVDLSGKSCDVVCEGNSVIAVVSGMTYVSLGSSTGFSLKSGEEEGMLPVGEFGNVKLAIASSNNDYMYASYVNTDGSLFNIYLSTNSGESWRVVYPGGSQLDDIFNGQGFRNNAITVHPNDEKTVILGAYNILVGYEAQPTGYYDWSQLSNGDFDPYPIMGTTRYVHFGINDIVFNPINSSHILIGNEGGLSISKDGFNSMQVLNRGLRTTQYFTINTSKAGDIIAGAQFNGLQEIVNNGSNQAYELLLNAAGGPSPKTGGHGHISFINPEFIVASSADGTFWRSEDAGENVSADITSGVSLGSEFITPFAMWESNNLQYPYDTVEFKAFKDYQAGEKIWINSNAYDFPFQVTLEQDLDSSETRLFMDKVGSRAFIAVEGEAKADFEGGVYMTTGMLDYTASPEWWQIGAVEGIPTCLAYSGDVNYVWVGTLEGRLFRLSNVARANTAEKADIKNPTCIIAIQEIDLPFEQAITSISVDQKNSDNVMVTFGNYGNTEYVMKSTDGQADVPEFSSAQGNLPQMPVYSSSFILNSTKAFVGTENGLFYTDNIYAGTVDWKYEDSPFKNVPVFALKQQTNNWPQVSYALGDSWVTYPGATNFGALYVGTFGNGAYVTQDFVGFEEFAAPAIEQNSILAYPNPASYSASISYNSSVNGVCNIEVFDLSGKLIQSVQTEIQSGQNTIELDVNGLNNGSYLVRLTHDKHLAQTKLIISK